jgi:hypothetical protein
MTNIRDFTPGQQEQRGLLTVQRYPDDPTAGHFDQPEMWRFSIPVTAAVDGKPMPEIWLRLSYVAIGNYQDDGKILNVVATELRQMAITSDSDAALADGRKISDLTPEDLYQVQ